MAGTGDHGPKLWVIADGSSGCGYVPFDACVDQSIAFDSPVLVVVLSIGAERVVLA
jgi:hypothetical protein